MLRRVRMEARVSLLVCRVEDEVGGVNRAV